MHAFATLRQIPLLLGLAACAEAPLVDDAAQLERLGEGFGFTEGPTVLADGSLRFTDLRTHKIWQWSPATGITLWRADSGGANGLFATADALYVCEGARRRVTRIRADGTTAVLSDGFAGKRLNSPNDLWVDAQGGVWFTDPRYGARGDLEQPGEHVYHVGTDGRTRRVVSDLVRPNGIVGTPDGTRLYVADEGGGRVWTWRIVGPGELQEPRVFATTRSDGICLDARGNLYVTDRAVKIYSPAGVLLRTIATPFAPTNVCFGGPDRRTLFVTGGGFLHALRMHVRGVE